MLSHYQDRLRARAAGLAISLESRLDRIMQAWLLVAGLACAARIFFNPLRGTPDAATLLPYALLILAPFASMVLAMRWFADGDRMAQPRAQLIPFGKWRQLDFAERQDHPLYGTGGIMASLMVGILLNVPVRAFEFLTAMPALPGTIPRWLTTLSVMMTVDVVVFTSLYAIVFVAALRRSPFFPRLLIGVWLCDIVMQVAMSKIIGAAPGLPSAVGEGLQALLQGNVQKVMVSVAVWLPYLLLSRRVNVTFRHRVRA